MSTQQPVDIAVVGATGLVGETMLALIDERRFPAATVHALASADSAGGRVVCGDRELEIGCAGDFDFSRVRIALFSAGAAVAGELAPRAAAAGCLVIDNSSCFRYDDDKLLVVPEINGRLLADLPAGPGAIVANPNCSTIQMLMALAPLHRRAGIRRINVSTYQSVSGAGRAAMEGLARQTIDRLSFRDPGHEPFGRCLAFDLWPQIDTLLENGYTREEMKLVRETRKILNDAGIAVNATAVRVPVFYGHALAVHVELCEALDHAGLLDLLEQQPGVKLMNHNDNWPSPAAQAGTDDVYVGRIRRDLENPCAWNLWVVADNVRKGAALNALQIAERWIQVRAGRLAGRAAVNA